LGKLNNQGNDQAGRKENSIWCQVSSAGDVNNDKSIREIWT